MYMLHVTYMYTLDLMWSASVIVACKQEMLYLSKYTHALLYRLGADNIYSCFFFFFWIYVTYHETI